MFGLSSLCTVFQQHTSMNDLSYGYIPLIHLGNIVMRTETTKMNDLSLL